MTWLTLILLCVLAYSISVVLQKIILRNNASDPIVYSVLFQLLTGLIVFVYAYFTKQITWFPIGSVLPNVLAMSVLYGAGNVFVFKSLQTVDASKFTVIFSGRGLVTILASTLVLGEKLIGTQYIGAFLIMLGIIVVSISQRKINFEKDDFFAIMAAICFGLANTNDRYLLGSLNLYQYIISTNILPGLMIGAIYLARMKGIMGVLRSSIIPKMAVLSFFYAVAGIFFFSALKLAPSSSQLASISLTSTILIAILGIIFLNERENIVKKIVGAFVSLVGLLLVAG